MSKNPIVSRLSVVADWKFHNDNTVKFKGPVSGCAALTRFAIFLDQQRGSLPAAAQTSSLCAYIATSSTNVCCALCPPVYRSRAISHILKNMWRFKRTFIRPLLLALLLVMGPVHAQVVFACAMMDMAVQGECDCCDHENGKACVDSDCDMAVDSGDGPCCEQSVEFSLDDDARQNTPGAKPAEMRSDAGRPQSIIASFDLIEPPRVVAAPGVRRYLPTPGRFGSDTYLITQRLRI